MIPTKTKVAPATGRRWLHLAGGPRSGRFRRTCRRAVARGAHCASRCRPPGRRFASRDRWHSQRTQDAAGRYAQAMADADSLERFNRQLEEQVQAQEDEVASIERQLVEIETTTREVQPLMQQMVDTLDRFIELDIPFLPRSARRACRAKD